MRVRSASPDAVMPAMLLDGLSVRAVEGEENTYEFTAATENGVMSWAGPEVLRMSGVQLDRFRKNPVILDAHNRSSASAVIGRGAVEKKGREMSVRVTFAKTARAQEIQQLVAEGMIHAVSVGFVPLEIKELGEGESDGRGEHQVRGPAVIVKKWELYEVSIVPVPADADAVRRSLAAIINRTGTRPDVSDRKETDMKLFQKWLEKRGLDIEDLSDKRRTELEAECERDLFGGGEPPKDEAKTFEARVRAIAPRGLKAEDVDAVVLEFATEDGGNFAAAKERLLKIASERSQSVGTPEPEQPAATKREDGGEAGNDDADPEEKKRALDDAVGFFRS